MLLKIAATLAFAGLIVRYLPETAVARFLQRQLVDRLCAVERRHFVYLAMLAFMMVAGAEWIALAAPLDGGILLFMWDMSALVDAAIALSIASTSARFLGFFRRPGLNKSVAKPLARPRQRHRVSGTKQPAANDDDHGRHQRSHWNKFTPDCAADSSYTRRAIAA